MVSTLTQRAHDVISASMRRCDVITSHRRRSSDVRMTSCACWEESVMSQGSLFGIKVFLKYFHQLYFFHFFFYFFFFNSVLCPVQDYFSSYETWANRKVGRKRENPEKNHLAHAQAELGMSHMWPVRGSNPHQTQR